MCHNCTNMQPVLYVTSNYIKFHLAKTVCGQFDVPMERTTVENVHEIQAETGEPVARDKAEKVFAALKRPIVVSDDSWIIPGLRGFPGPYMKSMNDWFTAADWMHLTAPLEDRRIILRQVIVYQDAERQKMFTIDLEGTLLREPRGESPYPHSTITSFDGGQHSNAEFHERGESAAQSKPTAWHAFAEWFASQQ